MSDRAFADLTLAHIEAARERVRGAAVRTPLVRLHVPPLLLLVVATA